MRLPQEEENNYYHGKILLWEIVSTVKSNTLNLKLTGQQKLQEKGKLRKLFCDVLHKKKRKSGANYG